MSKNPPDILAELFPTPQNVSEAALLPASEYREVKKNAQIPIRGKTWVVIPLHKLANLAVETLVESNIDGVCEGALVELFLAGRKTRAWVLFEKTSVKASEKVLPQVTRVITAKKILTPAIWKLVQEVAKRNGGGVTNLLAQAIPPRKAGVEKKYFAKQLENATHVAAKNPQRNSFPPGELLAQSREMWKRYHGGEETLARLRRGEKSRCYWQALPDYQRRGAPFYQIAALAEAAQSNLGSVLVLFPFQEQAEEFIDILLNDFQTDPERILPYHSGVEERYQHFLRARFEKSLIVVGVSGAVWAPLSDLALTIVWDDGADSYQMQTFPYAYARQIAGLRTESSLVLAGYATSVYAAGLVDKSWLVEITPRIKPGGENRCYVPTHENRPGDETPYNQRIPSSAWKLLRSALQKGAVLVQIPQIATKHSFYCRNCRQSVCCYECAGPLYQVQKVGQYSYASKAKSIRTLAAQSEQNSLPTPAAKPNKPLLQCRSCGAQQDFICLNCGSVLYQEYIRQGGITQTAQQLAQALQTKVEISYGQARLNQVDGRQSLVVLATPGAEPRASHGGYRGGILLDAQELLAFDKIWVQEEALRRWANAISLVNGPCMVLGNIGKDLADTLRSGKYGQWAQEEYRRRELLGLPPAWGMLQLKGERKGIENWWQHLQLALGEVSEIRWIPPYLCGQVVQSRNSSQNYIDDFTKMYLARVMFPSQFVTVVGEKCQEIKALATRHKWGKVKISFNAVEEL